MISGFDVSHHQSPAGWDWPLLAKAEGIRFMVARASYGSGTADRHFVEYSKRVRDAGLSFGAYLFYRQIHGADAQLALFEKQLEAGGGVRKGDIFPTLDMEENERFDGVKPKASIFGPACRRIAESLRAAYGGCILYYSAYFPEWLGVRKSGEFWDWAKEPGYFHWIADYNRPPGGARTPYTPTMHIHQPLPKPSALFSRAKHPVDHDYLAENVALASLLVSSTDEGPSDDAIKGEKDTTNRPGGSLESDREDLEAVRDGLKLTLGGIEGLIEARDKA